MCRIAFAPSYFVEFPFGPLHVNTLRHKSLSHDCTPCSGWHWVHVRGGLAWPSEHACTACAAGYRKTASAQCKGIALHCEHRFAGCYTPFPIRISMFGIYEFGLLAHGCTAFRRWPATRERESVVQPSVHRTINRIVELRIHAGALVCPTASPHAKCRAPGHKLCTNE